MMRWIIGSSLRFRYLVVFLAAVLVFFGYRELRDAPVDVFPEFAPPRVEIQTSSLGLSSTEVEEFVTIPLEQALTGVEGVDVMRSKSVPQLSSIVLIFEPGTDIMHARQLVSERLATVTPTLPSWSTPPHMIQPLSSTSRTMKIGISSDEVSQIELSAIARFKIRARLLDVPGVANVPMWGFRKQHYSVQVETERLRALGVSLEQVKQTTADALDAGLLRYSDGAVVGTGGFLETPNQRLGIEHVLSIVDPADLANVPIEGESGLVLSDVATLVEDHQPLIGDAVINDGPGLLLIVEKFPWANTLEVTEGVEEAIDELRPGLPGIKIDTTIFRPATFIETSIDNLTEALVIAAVLVILILVLFLLEWRTALISVVAIPLSLVAAGLVLTMLGTTINVMILAGLVIAVGVVVDDAIIDIENIWRRLRQHRSQGSDKSTARIILDASVEVRSAIVHATLMDVVVLVPVFLLEGLSGSFFRPLALSYILAVGASMVVAMTVTPAMGMILLSKAPLNRRDSPLVRLLKRGYEFVLARIIQRPVIPFAGVAVFALAGVAVLPQLGQELLPSFKERDFLMHWVTNPDTSHPEMVRITTQASRELRAIPGVRNFGAHIGQAQQGDEPYGIYFAENWISVDPDADYDETLAAIQETVDGYPGLRRDVQTYLKERIREVLTGASEAIVVRIVGPDLHVLRTEADEIRDALSEVEGLADLHVELHTDLPQLQIEVNLARAERYGLKPGDVRRAVGVLVPGEEVGDTYRNGRSYDVMVKSTPDTRRSFNSIAELLIDTPDGGHVRLGDVADVRLAPSPNVVEREDQSRKIDVVANVSERDLGSVGSPTEGPVS